MYKIYWDTYLLYVSSIIKNKNNVYYMKNKSTGEVFSCFLWTGPNCVFDDNRLISNETIIFGPTTNPLFLSPGEFLNKYEFTRVGRNGIIDIPMDSVQYKNMMNAKKLLENAAKLSA